MKKFWNWIHDDSGGRVLRLEGPIDSESFWGDETTPQAFRDDLYADEGDITLWINSPGGNVFAAAEIYTMLRDYPGNVTVRIASIAASAASVVAMAGDLVQISPTGMLMIHDPATIAMGNARDMEKAISTLNEVKESIINAYAFKTGLTRNRISKLMSEETWINAKKAVELGFADEKLFEDLPKKAAAEDEPDDPDEEDEPDEEENGDEGKEGAKEKKPLKLSGVDAVWQFSSKLMGETILNRLGADDQHAGEEQEPEADAPAQEPSPAGLTETEPEAEEPVDDTEAAPQESDKPTAPSIGMNGKTEDGAMPYELLKNQLDFLR